MVDATPLRPPVSPRPYVLQHVPDLPTNGVWVDVLRWCVAVMNADDRDLGFIASLLSHAVARGLTERQERYASKTTKRIAALWSAMQLECQQIPDGAA